MNARRVAGLIVLVGTASAGPVRAQSRGSDAGVIVGTPTTRCAVHAHVIEIQAPAAADTHAQVAVAAVDDRVLLAWRTRDGGLEITRLAAALTRADDDREIARPAGPFAMISTADGAAVVVVQRRAGGDDVVLLARLASNGEAHNVPRELGRTRGIDGVAIAPTASGYAVAWGARADVGGGTYLSVTDDRGAPSTPPRRVLDGTAPRLAWLVNAQTLVVSATTPQDSGPNAVAIESDGTILDHARLDGSDRAIVTGPAGASLLALGVRADADASRVLVVQRWTPGAEPGEPLVAQRVGAASTIVSAVADRAGALVALDDAAGHETLLRVGADGTTVTLGARTAPLGSLANVGDAAIIVAAAEPIAAGAHGIDVLQLACPRAVAPGATQNADAQTAPTGAAMP